MRAPLLSVCIPNLDMERYVGGAIRSALAQSEPDLEVVVLDNASCDGSWDAIRAAAAGEPRVRCFRNARTLPMAANWNACLARARGTYFVLLSADDELHPEFAARGLALFRRFPELGYVFTHTSTLDAEGREAVGPAFYEASAAIPGLAEARLNLCGSHNGPSEMLVHRERFLALGGWDPGYEWAHDMDAKLRLNLHFDVGYLDAPLCRYRVHARNSTARMLRSKLGVMEIYRLKLSLLEALPERARGLAECREAMLENLARLCERYGATARAAGEARLALEYEHLARSFAPAREVPAAEAKAGPPWPLPSGALRLDAHTMGGWQ
jgi:glycosyltransferase involved in cell wall biosynthesis